MARWSPGEINLKVAIAAMSRTCCRMCRQSKRPRPHLRPSVPMEESSLGATQNSAATAPRSSGASLR
ncbi:unnamed protein product [Symbiodinium sp. KB8]|nr:unnamed protein product [Symbiodinium sp. KB8]